MFQIQMHFLVKKKKREGEIKGKEGRRGGRKERGREEGIKKRMRNNLISSPATLIKAGKDFIRSQSMMDSMAWALTLGVFSSAVSTWEEPSSGGWNIRNLAPTQWLRSSMTQSESLTFAEFVVAQFYWAWGLDFSSEISMKSQAFFWSE